MDDGEIQKINYFLEILEKSKVGEIIQESYKKTKPIGRKSYDPCKLFASLLYSFAMHRGSLRDMEEFCKYDLRMWYLMEQEKPSYKTIAEFINDVIVGRRFDIFTKITSAIIKELGVDISDQYLDGTKIEANANKYKFVWKPRKYHKNLDEKIREFLIEIGTPYEDAKYITARHLLNKLKQYGLTNTIVPEKIPYGKGVKRSKAQKTYLKGLKYLNKLMEYEEKEKICGPNRNSFYKTDHDATAMALKTDYYSGHGSNMHAAYNIQFLVAAGFITFFSVFQDRTDYHTLIPLLNNYSKYYQNQPCNLCADAGYGIYENYHYLSENNIGNYVKFQNWQGESSGKNPQLIYFDEVSKSFTCLNGVHGREVPYGKSYHQKAKGLKLYLFDECESCKYCSTCKKRLKNKDETFRFFEINPYYEELKNLVRKNLHTIKGIEIRVNRSIQAEGAFGQLKQNMMYVRTRRRGLSKVSTEIMLMALAINVRKMLSIYKNQEIPKYYWHIDPATIE